MYRLATSSVRGNFAEILNRVVYKREHVVLQRHGKDVAALVPFEDLVLLKELSALSDLMKPGEEKTGGNAVDSPEMDDSLTTLPWERIETDLGL